MGRLRLAGASIAVLCCAAVAASGASAKMANLVLKEEGMPVAAGTELAVELELRDGETCSAAWPGRMSLNAAKDDKLTVEPTEKECTTPTFTDTLSGSLTVVEMTGKHDGAAGGKVTISGSLRDVRKVSHLPRCTYEITLLRGRFDLPGEAQTTVLARIRAVPGDPRICHTQRTLGFAVTIRGRNNSPLETELIG
jgi:hypothetical protein